MKNVSIVAVAVGCLVGLAVAQTGPAPATRPAGTSPAATQAATTAPGKRAAPITVTGRADPRAPACIVLFEAAVDAKAEVARLEKLYGFKATHTYNMGADFKGFAATFSAEVLEKLRWELSIKSIEHDGVATINGGGMGIQ